MQAWVNTVAPSRSRAFAEFLAWAGDYRVRDNANSFAGHQRNFAAFAGSKAVLRSRSEVRSFSRAPLLKTDKTSPACPP